MRSGHLRKSLLCVSKKRRGLSAIVMMLTVSTWPSTTIRRGILCPSLPRGMNKRGKDEVRPPVEKGQYKWCFKRGHYQKNCIEFLKHLNKTGGDHVTFVDEFIFLSYVKSTLWIDSDVTIHVANSIHGFVTRRTIRRGKRSIRVTNDVEAEVEAIGELSLELNNDCILRLHNIFYVPYLSRNLIFVSCLDDYDFDCQFGNE
jgi:hypothetical protein